MKDKFYYVAKNQLEKDDDRDVTAMKKYQDDCSHFQIAAQPIFSRIQEGKCSIIGQYVSNEQALAFGKMLENLAKAESRQMFFDEITLDYNGIKDEQFCLFLKALQHNKYLKKITYVNNEIGKKSIEEL